MAKLNDQAVETRCAMRKRLRKKLRLREFIQLAFLAKAQVNPGLPEAARESLLDRFIVEAIESNDLSCGGGCGPLEWDLIVCANGRRSSSEADRERVRACSKLTRTSLLCLSGRLLTPGTAMRRPSRNRLESTSPSASHPWVISLCAGSRGAYDGLN
jgi:hypothetical protein